MALPQTNAMPSDPASIVEAFQTNGYAVIDAMVPQDRVARLRDRLAAREKAGTLLMIGDQLVPNTPTVYGDAETDALMQDIKPLIEAHTGLQLHPTYSYARIYKKGDTLAPHRDRPACQVSISLNLGQEPDTPWTLWIGDENAPFAAKLRAGDALLYKGMDLTHWRDAYEGERLFQVFVHYVDANGPYAGEKFDSRASLGNAFKPEITGLLTRLMVPSLTGR
jgi:hypothetical protein